MSVKRVQKLLFSEYCDFEDMVLIESPFAQTTREGHGLRQVHLGLTPSKLVLATDVLQPVERSSVNYLPGLDPDIETFELIAIYPIECVNLSVYRRHQRQALKAHFCNNRVYYFELGGFENRSMLWNLWCEKVRFLSPEVGSSNSETSVATSSTNSTLYLLESTQVEKADGLKQLWCKFGTGKDPSEIASTRRARWTDRCLFLGSSEHHYTPIMAAPRMSEFLKTAKKQISNYCVTSTKTMSSLANEIHIGDSYHVNRFEEGVKEGCNRPLFLPAENYIVPRCFSQISDRQSLDTFRNFGEYAGLEEACVLQWERRRSRVRHRRRYGIAPQPLFLHGLGPWKVNPGAQYSIQVKRAVSLVTIRKQPSEPELRLPVTKRQLVATISCETLQNDKTKILNQIGYCGPRRPVVIFWTPNYWYRPRSAKEAYLELQEHLAKIKTYHQKTRKKRRLFRRRYTQPKYESTSDSDSDNDSKPARSKKQKNSSKKSMLGFHMMGGKTHNIAQEKKNKETFVQYLKRLLKVDVLLTGWDFNSTDLAQQLTMIDRDLFLKISSLELGILVHQQSSKNAPNIGALIAFSHRVSCLVASDILKNKCERMRARMIARFINVAYKCHKISNFQSCRTVLFGLQSPGIYRLQRTWAYVRKKHATKYENFEFLCRLYKDPRLFSYQKAFFISSQDTPYLPFIGDIIAKLLDRIPRYRLGMKSANAIIDKPAKSPQFGDKIRSDNLFTKLLMSMKLLNFQQSQSDFQVRAKGLCDYYQPLNVYEDNREQCLMQTTEFLQNSQLSALHYNFVNDNLTLDYLLKARYKEERENFFDSISLEN